MANHADPYHAAGAPSGDHVEPPRNPKAVAAEQAYQKWNALVLAKDTDGVIRLHNSLMAAAKSPGKPPRGQSARTLRRKKAATNGK